MTSVRPALEDAAEVGREAEDAGLLRIAVVADMHAFRLGESTRRPSHFDINAAPNEAAHVTRELGRSLAGREHADYLFCCGDMGDQAEPDATRYAWQELQTLALTLGANTLFAASGNHDLDSRFKHNNFDARGVLQALENYPSASSQTNLNYWAYHFAIADNDPMLVVLLNSSAYHGNVKAADIKGNLPEPEYLHGRVAASTLARLKTDLAKSPRRELNILLCHHHFNHYLPDADAEDRSVMTGAAAVQEALGAGPAEWVVIHGHTHTPKLALAGGGARSPWIFSAGSLASTDSYSPNQFYILEFDLGAAKTLGLRVACRFKSWNYVAKRGWQRAGSKDMLPGRGGFGKRSLDDHEIDAVVASLEAVTGRTRPCTWHELVAQLGWVEFLQPTDVRALAMELASRGIVTDEEPESLTQISTFDWQA